MVRPSLKKPKRSTDIKVPFDILLIFHNEQIDINQLILCISILKDYTDKIITLIRIDCTSSSSSSST